MNTCPECHTEVTGELCPVCKHIFTPQLSDEEFERRFVKPPHEKARLIGFQIPPEIFDASKMGRAIS